MKKIFIILSWLNLFLILVDGFFKYRYNLNIGYIFIEMVLNPSTEYSFYQKFILLLVFFMVISAIFIYFIKNNKVILSIVFILLSFLLFYFNILVNLYNGYLTYKIVHNIKVRLYNDTNITFNDSYDRLIAHAGGKINKDIYTDSLEALNNSYNNGIRYFELDILKTSDNKFIAFHDWKSWQKMTNINHIPTKKEFLKYKILGKYTPLDMDRINKWFNFHKDAILITDKINTPLKFADKFIDKKRLQMELFSMESVIKALNSKIIAMPTWDILVRFIPKNRTLILKNLGVEYVVVPYDDFIKKEYRKIFENFSKNGIKVYIYGNYGKKFKFKNFYGKYINDTIKKSK